MVVVISAVAARQRQALMLELSSCYVNQLL